MTGLGAFGGAPNQDDTVVVTAVATRSTVFLRLERLEPIPAEIGTGGAETRAGMEGRG